MDARLFIFTLYIYCSQSHSVILLDGSLQHDLQENNTATFITLKNAISNPSPVPVLLFLVLLKRYTQNNVDIKGKSWMVLLLANQAKKFTTTKGQNQFTKRHILIFIV